MPENTAPLVYRAVRTRRGRGGVLRVDRRAHQARTSRDARLSEINSKTTPPAEDNKFDVEERMMRLRERWRFDNDDEPPVGPDGPDEQDRTLIDDPSQAYVFWA